MEPIRVLVAEDIPAVIKLYQKGLGNSHFDVRYTMNGEEAMAEYMRWQPEVIVLDIMMPIKSGMMVLSDIRKEFTDLDTAIVMATSRGELEDVKACMEFGIEGYLLKPFNFRQLEEKVLEALTMRNPARVQAFKDYLEELEKDAALQARLASLEPKEEKTEPEEDGDDPDPYADGGDLQKED